MTDEDYVLIYYSGHGEEDGNQRYWIPVNGELESGYGDWININDIQLYIQNHISNTHIVMMSDSCYFAMETKGNQIQRDKKSQSYQKLLERRAVMIVGSGSNEPVADTSQDKHSMFGMSFIQSLKNNTNAIRMRDIVENIILSSDNKTLQLIFDDLIYNDQGSSTLTLDSFSFAINGGTLNANDIVISSISVDQKTVSFTLDYNNNASGEETLFLEIKENQLFDLAGNPVSSQQITNSVQLNDTTAPYLTAIELVEEKIVLLTFNEEVSASQNSTSSLNKTNFTLASDIASSTAIASEADEVIQNGKEVEIKFNLLNPVSSGEKLVIQLTTQIFDLSGNATDTLYSFNQVELILDRDQDGIIDELDQCPDTEAGQ